MAFSAFLLFGGNCREAVAFYAQAFGCELPKFMTYGEGPHDPNIHMTADMKNRIMYTSLPIGGVEIMFCDMPEDMQYIVGNNISPVVGYTDEAGLHAAFDRLGEGGKVDMPLQKTFWSGLYGMVTDRYGVTWQLNLDDGKARG